MEEEAIKKKLRKLKRDFPESAEQVERELIPHQGEEIFIKSSKKKKEDED
jgi:hypothetical protein